MDGNASDDSFNVDWNTDDDLEVESSSHTALAGIRENGESRLVAVRENGESKLAAVIENGEASSSSDGPRLSLISHFVGMGFSKKLVSKAVDENGDGDTEAILNAILTYSTLEESAPQEQSPAPQEQSPAQNSDPSTSDFNEMDLLLEMDRWSDDEFEEKPNVVSEQHRRLLTLDNSGSLSEKEKKLLTLANMGYTVEEASIAMDRCGPEASVSVFTDFILAAQMAREEDCYLPADDLKPKRVFEVHSSKKRKSRDSCKKKNVVVEDMIRLPNPMIGFGTPSMQPERIIRRLPEASQGPPYFYYENVALAPKGVWDTISRFLYEIEPEFVDSKYFSATARKRGYIHNLPLENRFPLIPLPAMTIKQAFPLSKRWWPEWDPREKLNCIQTAIGSAKLTERIRSALETCDGNPSDSVRKEVLNECRKWNLVWVGRNKVAPLEPDEMEMLLGFPKNHTRGGGISRTDRYKSLGNSFQVDTVAYHLSVLKNMFPDGINMLSLFSGIGGAEVALHRLGVKLRNVISIEKSKVNRDIVRSWWEQTNQTGNLVDFDDVQQFDAPRIEQIMESIGGFDLVVGGSPCNNLAGSNRVSRDGLEGTESSLFYDYFRILDCVRSFGRH